MKKSPSFPPEADELPSPLVDNHTHFPLAVDEVVELPGGVAALSMGEQVARAERAGVVGMIHSGCELPGLDAAVDLAREWVPVAAALAIHPNETQKHAGVTDVGPDGWEQSMRPHHSVSLDAAIARVAELSALPEVVAVGETGLDYFRAAERGRAVQREAFRAHIALAKELGKPLQIHDRDAHADVVQILLADGAPERTVFHCFSGDGELAEVLSANGWYASFAGPVTYKANEALRDALRAMDPTRVLVETDAPYLSPVPYRGRANAPYVMTHTVHGMAETLEVELTQLCQQIMGNTIDVYGEFWR
ncbi:MAG: TatD family hydrolase [Ruaniaceae bacterium]|nr:TatD family hydrolase [Ruaniaceae bacterium]